MIYREIFENDRPISALALGTMQFGWPLPKKECFDILNLFELHGGNFIDTSNNYPNWVPNLPIGFSETTLGEWFNNKKNRERIILATKVGKDYKREDTSKGLSKNNIIRSCEDSLKRLRTDYINIYQCHFYDDKIPLEETLYALSLLQKEGKILYFGCSNYNPTQLQTSFEVSEKLGIHKFITLQNLFNILRVSELENFNPFIEKNQIHFIAYNVLAAGFLSGKYCVNDKPVISVRKNQVARYYNNKTDYAVVRALNELSQKTNCKISQLSLIGAINNKMISASIIGTSSFEQMKENLMIFKFSEMEMNTIYSEILCILKNDFLNNIKPVNRYEENNYLGNFDGIR